MHIISVASGKGGVGKSLLSVNLSIALSEAGKKVILIDLDLGASNVHQMLGLSRIDKGIGVFLTQKNIKFEEVIVDSGLPNLKVVLGDAEIPGMANITSAQKKRLIKNITNLDTDYIIMDLGAGSSTHTIDFFLMSTHGIVVTSPALTATLNAYLFLKNVLFRLVTLSFDPKSKAGKHLKDLSRDSRFLQRLYMPHLLDNLKQIDKEGFELFSKQLEKMNFYLVMNLLADPGDTVKADKIRNSCQEYLNLTLEHLGIIYRDHFQDIAARSRLPILRYKPNTTLSQAIYRIAEKVSEFENKKGLKIDFQRAETSFQTAELEAEADLEAKVVDLQKLMQGASLSRGELIETIKAQRYEINSLKKENQLLKSKLLKIGQNR